MEVDILQIMFLLSFRGGDNYLLNLKLFVVLSRWKWLMISSVNMSIFFSFQKTIFYKLIVNVVVVLSRRGRTLSDGPGGPVYVPQYPGLHCLLPQWRRVHGESRWAGGQHPRGLLYKDKPAKHPHDLLCRWCSADWQRKGEQLFHSLYYMYCIQGKFSLSFCFYAFCCRHLRINWKNSLDIYFRITIYADNTNLTKELTEIDLITNQNI